MDNKEWIHIDELVRRQLSGREEELSPGAWGHMRELLDREMPAGKRPVVFGWKRATLLSVVAILMGAVSISAYRMLNGLPDTGKELAAYTADTAMPGGSSSRQASGEGQADGHAAESKGMPDGLSATAEKYDAHIFSPGVRRGEGAGTAMELDGTGLNTTPTGYKTIPGKTSGRAADGNGYALSRNAGTGASQSYSEPVHGGRGGTGRGPDHSGYMHADAPATPGNGVAAGNTPHAGKNRNVLSEDAVQSSSVEPGRIAGGEMPAVAATGRGIRGSGAVRPARPDPVQKPAEANTPLVQDDRYRIETDTVERINLVYRTVTNPFTRSKTVVLDTASIEKMIVERRIPLFSEQEAMVSSRTPLGRLRNRLTDIQPESGTVQAERQQSAKKQHKGMRFRDMYLAARYNLEQAKFHPGISAGVSTMFSGGAFIPGMQLGLSGEIELNERWSVMTEFRYITRFSNGFAIADHYTGEPYNGTALYNQAGTALESTVYLRDSTVHHYNLSTLGKASLPVGVRYSLNRFFMTAGIDLVYHFRISAEEVNRIITIRDTLPFGREIPQEWMGGGPSVQLSDLGPRLGFGYNVGAGYKVTPKMNLDLRLSHYFWDNARSPGSRKVSAQLYRMPHMQFTLGYRLGRSQSYP